MEDKAGPTIAEQVAMNPFEKVIDSIDVKGSTGQGMMIIHTKVADLYSRLWCVFELFVALTRNVKVHAAASSAFTSEMERRIALFSKHMFDENTTLMAAGTKTAACTAKCSNESDEEMIIEKIKTGGGFDACDAAIQRFRERSLGEQAKLIMVFTKLNSKDGLLRVNHWELFLGHRA